MSRLFPGKPGGLGNKIRASDSQTARREGGLSLVLGNGTGNSSHIRQLLRELIPPRSRDQQPFLGPGHAGVEEFRVLGGLGFRGFDLAEADEDHGAELKALAALHGQDVDLGFPGIVGPLAAAGGHEQMGDAECLELMGDPFSVVRLHADHGDVAEEMEAARFSGGVDWAF